MIVKDRFKYVTDISKHKCINAYFDTDAAITSVMYNDLCDLINKSYINLSCYSDVILSGFSGEVVTGKLVGLKDIKVDDILIDTFYVVVSDKLKSNLLGLEFISATDSIIHKDKIEITSFDYDTYINNIREVIAANNILKDNIDVVMSSCVIDVDSSADVKRSALSSLYNRR